MRRRRQDRAPEEDRKPWCDYCKKTAWVDEDEANEDLAQMDPLARPKQPVRVYPCPVRLNWWHVTSKP